jgi:hypothetical protein
MSQFLFIQDRHTGESVLIRLHGLIFTSDLPIQLRLLGSVANITASQQSFEQLKAWLNCCLREHRPSIHAQVRKKASM